MSPIRHEDDFRRVEINDWDEWIEGEIQKAQERGEFEALPLQGKPIEIYRTDVNPEYDLAFSRLKNAGIMPAWMELDAEVRRLNEELAGFLDHAAGYLAAQRAELERHLEAPEPEPGATVAYPRWQVWRPLLEWLRFSDEETEDPHGPRSIGDLIQLRDHMRAQYLERAAELDKRIVEYHNALPRELSNLQRLRLLPERAARRFDERMPVSAILGTEVEASVAS
jgi:hypothetical protein